MSNQEKINLEIEKQINAGFQPFEIRQNLLSLNFTADEVEEAFRQRNITGKPVAKKPSTQSHVLSLLVSVFFIFSGSMRISSAHSGSFLYTWGFIMLSVGVIGAIWKTIDLVRNS